MSRKENAKRFRQMAEVYASQAKANAEAKAKAEAVKVEEAVEFEQEADAEEKPKRGKRK
jgi:hypothetical protein